ncbi:VOC family protein [Rhizobium esperanzae]|uniref:Catechol 2,3-dioxygenase-like lactoylglutathione lyase family enzyme n=1 Tax=Rhizobium esperanzae TaxID=1967781 RepID=A0A7W6R777_9HYPH|nr:VOC family protein [Rhizobium esperanzae]MBB4237924.1 catechol 2,3-dioxygenase-like lactoylglutathione lyase family enzyme [Rhizobium esperanzae]
MATSKRRIDHIVLAVHDLEAAAEFYRRLGFQVGARNQHPWGTENRLVQFHSSFIELITVGEDRKAIPPHEPGRFSFGAFVRDYLACGQGFAMFVLDSPNAIADAKAFAQKEIGSFEPFFFERKGRRPDGSEIHVAFSLAFAMDARIPNACFFVCQQHFPENFWNPEFQKHANGATNIVGATLAAEGPAGNPAAFLAAFTGVPGWQDEQGGTTYALARGGSVHLERAQSGGCFTGYNIAVPDLARQQDLLSEMGIPFSAAGNGITVKAEHAFGAAITFVSGC